MNFYKDFDCIIFDLDGTLIDSIGAWKKVDDIFMNRRNLPIPKDFYYKVSTLNFRQAAEYVIAECGVTDTPEAVMAEWLGLIEYEYAHNIGMIDGAKEFVLKLKENGLKLALATASRKELYEPCLKRHGIYDCFDVFVTTDQVARKKGFPDVYLFAAQKLNVDPKRCCVFEDIVLGVKGAKMGDLKCVGVLEEHSKGDWDEIKKDSDLTIKSYFEIL